MPNIFETYNSEKLVKAEGMRQAAIAYIKTTTSTYLDKPVMLAILTGEPQKEGGEE